MRDDLHAGYFFDLSRRRTLTAQQAISKNQARKCFLGNKRVTTKSKGAGTQLEQILA
jgi:hypothetical protein